MYLHDLPDECPPTDSSEPNGSYLYRLIMASIINDSDFIPLYADRPHLKDSIDWCQWMWLSVFSSIDDRVKELMKLPKFTNISVSELQHDSWKVKATPTKQHSNHVTWRPYSSIDPKKYFEIIDLK
jgi:hypothetical protein